MSSGRYSCHVVLSIFRCFVLTSCLLAVVAQPALATAQPAADGHLARNADAPASVSFAQEGANGTDGNGSAGNESATNESSGNESAAKDGGGGIVGTIAGVFGGIFGFVGGILGGILSFFVDNIIGQAIIGLSVGVLIGLKILAIYIERYE